MSSEKQNDYESDSDGSEVSGVLEELNAKLEEECSYYREQYEVIDAKYQKLKKKTEKAYRKIEEDYRECEEEIDDLKDTIEELRIENARLQEDYNELLDDVDNSGELDELEHRLAEAKDTIYHYRSKYKEYKRENQILKDKLTEKNNENIRLDHELSLYKKGAIDQSQANFNKLGKSSA